MIIDFAGSYLNWLTHSGSFGRFNAEAYFKNSVSEWLLGSEVFACNVYGQETLFKEPVYSFQPLFSVNECRLFRTYQENNTSGDTVFAPDKEFKFHSIEMPELKQYVNIDLSKKMLSKKQIQCLITSNEYSLQFPIKHLNIHENNKQFQVETGPIIFTYQQQPVTGFIAFNKLDSFELLLSVPEKEKRKKKIIKENNCTIKILAHS